MKKSRMNMEKLVNHFDGNRTMAYVAIALFLIGLLIFIINSAIYVVYFLAILDFSSAVIESFTALVGIVSLYRLLTGDSNE